MKTYGQFCPVAKAAEIFCERWTALILRDLALGATRFSELQRGVPLMSPTLLSRRLKELEAEGIVERRPVPSGRSKGYFLTAAGEEFVPIVLSLGTWGQRWARRELAEHEVDLGLLVWALERGAHPNAFGDRRTLIQMEFTDQPKSKQVWWFLNEGGRTQLCVHDPGFEVDLYIWCSLADMVRLWRGDLSYMAALESGRLEVQGPQRLKRKLRAWLGISTLAHVKPAKAA